MSADTRMSHIVARVMTVSAAALESLSCQVRNKYLRDVEKMVHHGAYLETL